MTRDAAGTPCPIATVTGTDALCDVRGREQHSPATPPCSPINSVHVPPLHPAEEKAQLYLQEAVEIFDLLSHEDASRGSGSSFGLGCWMHDARCGLRCNTTRFPLVTKLSCRYVHQMQPEHRWTSLVFFDNVRAPKHRDVNNSADANLILPLTDFQGGDIFVCHHAGAEKASLGGVLHHGYSLPVTKHPCLLPARDREHFTLPWNGRRLVLVALSAALRALVDESSRACLTASGFQLPAPEFPPQPPLCVPKPKSTCPQVSFADETQHHPTDPNRPAPAPCLQPSNSAATPSPSAPSLDLPGWLLIELCAGSARLSRVAQKCDMNAVPNCYL